MPKVGAMRLTRAEVLRAEVLRAEVPRAVALRAAVLRAAVLRAVAVAVVAPSLALGAAGCATTQTTSPRSLTVSSELAASQPAVSEAASSGPSGVPGSGGPKLGCVSGCAASSGPVSSQPAATSAASGVSSGPAYAAATSATGGSIDPALERRLWALAVAAATADGGTVKEAQAVSSTRTRAVNVTMGDGSEDDDQPVLVVQVEGVGEFVCSGCSYPQGGVAPRGRFQVLVVTASALRTLDFGLTDTDADLTQLGTVVDLHP
jgi:hypothetical protein